MALDDTELFDGVVEYLVGVILDGIDSDEIFRVDVTVAADENMEFSPGESERCEPEWNRLYNEAATKIRSACRKAGL